MVGRADLPLPTVLRSASPAASPTFLNGQDVHGWIVSGTLGSLTPWFSPCLYDNTFVCISVVNRAFVTGSPAESLDGGTGPESAASLCLQQQPLQNTPALHT